MVKCLLAMGEIQVQSLVWEDPLEKAMAPHASILAWKIPLVEETCSLGAFRRCLYQVEELPFHCQSLDALIMAGKTLLSPV